LLPSLSRARSSLSMIKHIEIGAKPKNTLALINCTSQTRDKIFEIAQPWQNDAILISPKSQHSRAIIVSFVRE
jgi:hypothetical protein